MHRDGAKAAMAKYFYFPLLLGAGEVWAQNGAHTDEYPEGKYPDTPEGRPNYEGGIQVTKLADSCLRHLFSFLQGVDNDAESGKPHLHHLQCCLSMMSWMVDNRPDLDDRPHPVPDHVNPADVPDHVKAYVALQGVAHKMAAEKASK